MKEFVVHKTNFTKKGFLKENKSWLDMEWFFFAKDWLGVVSNCIMGLFLGRYRVGSLSKGVFERRNSTGSEVFFISKHLDATKFVSLSVFTIIETICPKIWAKPQSTDPFRLTCVAQKCHCLSSLFIDYYEAAQETGANNRHQKLSYEAITHKTAKWPNHTYCYTFPICNWIQRTSDVG